MAEFTLKSGRTLTIDTSELTVKEWRDFVAPNRGTLDDENTVVSKVSGLTVDEIEGMNRNEYRRLIKVILNTAREPIDPN